MDEHLAAVCGLYCGACTLYRARRDDDPERLKEILADGAERYQVSEDMINCDGCLGGGMLTPYCQACGMRHCAEERPDATRCADCPDYPCDKITDFKNDGVRHHAEVFDNLEHLRVIGAEKWIVEQVEKWSCSECGKPSNWYARVCYSCGATQPYRLPKLPRDER
jgi:hypothetical protein